MREALCEHKPSNRCSFCKSEWKDRNYCPTKNPDALAKAINIFLENPSLRKKYGSYAKKRVKEEFAREVMVKKLLDVYKNLM